MSSRPAGWASVAPPVEQYPRAMRHDRWHQEHRNQSWQQPDGANDDPRWQCQINSTDGKKREYRLPARFWFVDVLC